MKQYVAGLAFREDVLFLIRKNKPDWMKGKLNAVGGKVEDGELVRTAMQREFLEETGVDIEESRWTNFLILQGLEKHKLIRTDPDGKETEGVSYIPYEVWFFVTRLGIDETPRTMEDEQIVQVRGTHLLAMRGEMMSNLSWIIEMSYGYHSHDWPYLVKEKWPG